MYLSASVSLALRALLAISRSPDYVRVRPLIAKIDSFLGGLTLGHLAKSQPRKD